MNKKNMHKRFKRRRFGNNNPTIYDISPECKAMVIKKVYEHYTMNIIWREICQKFSTMCIFIFPVISLYSPDIKSLQVTIVFVSALISLLVTFFCDTKEYYVNLHIIKDIYLMDCKHPKFEEKFRRVLPLIREIDFARGRCDYTSYCKETGITPLPKDVVTKHDNDEMDRQRFIIAGLCFMVLLLCILLMVLINSLDNITKVILIFIGGSTLVGFIFMLFDCNKIKLPDWIKNKFGGKNK